MNRLHFVPILVLAALLVACFGALAAELPDEDTVLARVDGEPLRVSNLNIELNSFLTQAKNGRLINLPTSEDVLRRLIQNRLLEQEGYRIDLQESWQVRNQVDEFLRVKSVVAMMDSVSAEAAVFGQAQLDSVMDVSRRMRRYSHILLATQEQARDLTDSLAAGAVFADLARRHSIDNNAQKGGDLGWAGEGAYVSAFEAIAAPLRQGEVGGPVETEFGWHLITLTELREETYGQNEAMRQAMRDAMEKENRMAAVRDFVAGLRAKHGVTVDHELLASLEFGSEDAEVVQALRTDNRVLVELPTGRMTVAGLNRTILYTYFHGLSGREDAGTIKEKVFREWVDEALLTYEAKTLNFHRQHDLIYEAEQIERRLIREELLKTYIGTSFEPKPEEVESYYASHREDFLSAPRVKLESVLLDSEEAAQRFHSMLGEGAQLDWLAARDPGVLDDGAPPLPQDWVRGEDLAFPVAELLPGAILGPLPQDDSWVVAKVSGHEEGKIRPLEEIRRVVIGRMSRERSRKMLDDAFERLEAVAEIEILPEADKQIGASIDYYASIIENLSSERKPPAGSMH